MCVFIVILLDKLRQSQSAKTVFALRRSPIIIIMWHRSQFGSISEESEEERRTARPPLQHLFCHGHMDDWTDHGWREEEAGWPSSTPTTYMKQSN